MTSVHSWTSVPHLGSTRHIPSITITSSITSSITSTSSSSTTSSSSSSSHKKRLQPLHATQKKDPQNTTEKYGLEAGLFESLTRKKEGTASAQSLLKKYGAAYLATSIPLSLISFTLCYFLVDAGIDVAALLGKVGIEASLGGTGDKIGTVAIAYAAHKAASPIRFPPTVLLTPVMAKLLGKEVDDDVDIDVDGSGNGNGEDN